MYGRIKNLTNAAMKNRTYNPERKRGTPQSVSMSQISGVTSQRDKTRRLVHDDPQLRREVIEYPNIVIPDKPMYLYPAIGKLGDLPEKTGKSSGYHMLILIPVIENIAQQINHGGIVFDGVEPTHDTAFPVQTFGR